jgi:serine/threonine-protein phosphatase 2A regulatory subunit B
LRGGVQAAHFLLTTNDKTIKLWKVHTKQLWVETGMNMYDQRSGVRDPSSITSLRVPTLHKLESRVEAQAKRVYANAHAYHINSISVNWCDPELCWKQGLGHGGGSRVGRKFLSVVLSERSDDETFLSADDLRINLWNLSINDQSFNIVDIKPENMEELTEVSMPCSPSPEL